MQNAAGNFIITQPVPYPYYIVDDTQPTGGNLPTNACTINVDQTGKRLQAMGDNSVQQQPSATLAIKSGDWMIGVTDR